MAAHDAKPTAGALATAACLAEVAAPKVGNVSPGKPFDDASSMDFVNSALAVGPVLDRVAALGVGRTILECVGATRAVTAANTNLGMILLLAPLCAAAGQGGDLRTAVRGVLDALTPADADAVYQAIRETKPGGLGVAEQGDVSQPPTISLLDAMRLSADRDAVARQYTNGFADVLGAVADDLCATYKPKHGLHAAIMIAHLRLMAREPDSLIRRKCGDELAGESQRRAAHVLDALITAGPDSPIFRRLFVDFDHWLRADGHRRNPGTSADLIAAGLFVCFHEGRIPVPPDA